MRTKPTALVLVALAALMSLLTTWCVPSRPDPEVPVVTGGAPVADAGVDVAPPPQPCEYSPSSRAARQPDPRIVGGTPSLDGAYPWATALETSSGFQYCGGSVIGEHWVLTAAHCQVGVGDLAHVGTVDLRVPGRRIVVTEVRNHAGWHSTTSGHDVAVLRLEAPAGVPAVPLADTVASEAVAIGWGATCEGCSTSSVLRHVTVPVLTHAECGASYPGDITDDMLCAGAGGIDSCQGDSGGPLVMQTGSGWAQLGVVSWGAGCARPGSPGVYTSVPVLRGWVEACTTE